MHQTQRDTPNEAPCSFTSPSPCCCCWRSGRSSSTTACCGSAGARLRRRLTPVRSPAPSRSPTTTRAIDGRPRAQAVACNSARQFGLGRQTRRGRHNVRTTAPADGCDTAAPSDSCVRVDTYRDGTNASNLLPTWFANLFGTSTRAFARWRWRRPASATPPVSSRGPSWTSGSRTTRPIGAPWTSTGDTVDPTRSELRTCTQPPTSTRSRDRFHVWPTTWAPQITAQALGSRHDASIAGWFQALDLAGGGGDGYRENIKGCVNDRVQDR